jgi:hypothetical protein
MTRATLVRVCAVVGAVLLGASPEAAPAQRPMSSGAAAPAVTIAGQPSAGQSFALEAAGGIAGSMLGFGVIYLSNDRCGVEDLGCTLESVFTGIVIGTVASAGGAYFAGKAGNTDPSLLGASLGAIAGVGAGIGLWALFTEQLDVGNKEIAAALTFTVTQGLVTALGSRLLRGLR